MDNYQEQIQTALEVTEEASKDTKEVTLSTGVVLKLKRFPFLRLQAVAEQFEYPEVPKVFNKDKGRMEENPFSEHYVKAVEEVDRKRGMAVVDTILAIGTEPKYIPPLFAHPEQDDWIDELVISGISVKDGSKVARYLAWVKYVAIMNENDLNNIVSQATLLTGSGEAAVAQQLQQNFPSN